MNKIKTSFEKSVGSVVADYLKDKDISKMDTLIDLEKWIVEFAKYLSEVRTKEDSVNAIMDSVKFNTGSYWEEWVKPYFSKK